MEMFKFMLHWYIFSTVWYLSNSHHCIWRYSFDSVRRAVAFKFLFHLTSNFLKIEICLFHHQNNWYQQQEQQLTLVSDCHVSTIAKGCTVCFSFAYHNNPTREDSYYFSLFYRCLNWEWWGLNNLPKVMASKVAEPELIYRVIPKSKWFPIPILLLNILFKEFFMLGIIKYQPHSQKL